VNDGKEKFSFLKAARAIIYGNWEKNAPFERDVFAETSKRRALSAGTDTAGGYLVPTEVSSEIIELLRAELVVKAAGARMLENLQGSPFEVIGQSGGATAYFVGENKALTESQQTFRMIKMEPHMLGALCKLSRRLVQLADPSAEQMVREDIAKVMALKVDVTCLLGTGIADEPLGVANAVSDLSVLDSTGWSVNGNLEPTYDALLNMQGRLEDANALTGKLAFISNPATWRRLKKQKVAQYSGQTDGQPIFAPIVTNAVLENNLGYPIFSTTQIPKAAFGTGAEIESRVFFGNWNELLIGMWGGMELEASTQAGDNTGGAFTSVQTWIRAIMEFDVAVRHVESFAHYGGFLQG
jgi:HK97 family phage major capsid protein